MLKGVPTYETDAIHFRFFFLLIALAACAQGKETKSELDYDQTKKMIVDILKQIKVRKLFKMY